MDLYHREILDRFIQNTGAKPESAQDILSRCNWDYHTALRMFTPSQHPASRSSSSYGYPSGAQVRHVPIIYVGSPSQAQGTQRPISQPARPNSQPVRDNTGYRTEGPSYGVSKPMTLVGGGHSGQGVRPVQVASQVPHIVTTPTATRPTPTPQPTAVIHPARYVAQQFAPSRPASAPQPFEAARSVSTVRSLPPHTSQVYVHDRGPKVDLPVSVEVPITHITSDNRAHPSTHPQTLAHTQPHPHPPTSGFVTVAPVSNQINHSASSSLPGLNQGSANTASTIDGNTQKAPLVRSNATDLDSEDGTNRTLKRGISKTSDNLLLVNKARDDVLHDIRESAEDQVQYFVDTPELTFILPDLTAYSEDFRGFLEKDLIETSTLISLEQAGCLNWWADVGICQRLHPMATTGDGNCLLHAASLAMWGFHDRDLILRKALYHSMTSGAFHGALFRQWRYQQTQVNKQTGLIYSEEEWKKEWENLLRLASTEPRRTQEQRARENSCCDNPITQGATSCRHSTVVYESLEEFHVFVLAHVLRRPVVVVADKVLRDTNGEALAPIPFGGIYLPLGCKPQSCHRTPLLLTYDAAHFSALVPMKREKSPEDQPVLPVAIPILDCQYELLPLHFAVDPGENFNWQSLVNDQVPSQLDLNISQKLELIEKYMNLEKLPFTKPEGDNDSDQRSSGSVDSDESVGSGGKDKRKDTKLQQQMHSVSKQFGSLGRSMGKKLKKNFGHIGKKNKAGEKNGTGSKNPTVATGVTQSTKLTASIPMLFDQEHVVHCAKLSTHRSDIQEQLVKNYLCEAKKRFEADRELKRLKAAELKSRLPVDKVEKDLDKIPVQCVTPGCTMFGTASCSYLCSDCFARSKKALEQVRSSASPFVYNTYPGPRSQTLPNSGDTVYRLECGKSKFYAPVAVEENLELRNPEKNFLNPVVNNVPISRPVSAGAAETRSVTAGNTSVCRPLASVNRNNEVNSSLPTINRRMARTPSPECHYDNVEYAERKTDERSGGERSRCLTAGCTFYGSEANKNYCSKCFKEKQRVQPEITKTQL